ncbi:MAG: transcriptional regulator [Clostridiales bacterium 43-6]|mgnify:CR=1 FL=1|nr:MAG: transcriptional regulator [Clostridiales bacterium 43-6]
MERNDSDKLGSILKAARIAKNITREHLSEVINITPRYLMSIENENKKPSFNVLFQLVRELSIPADTIFYPESENNNTEVEQLIRLLYLCDERDLKIATATVRALVDNK